MIQLLFSLQQFPSVKLAIWCPESGRLSCSIPVWKASSTRSLGRRGCFEPLVISVLVSGTDIRMVIRRQMMLTINQSTLSRYESWAVLARCDQLPEREEPHCFSQQRGDAERISDFRISSSLVDTCAGFQAVAWQPGPRATRWKGVAAVAPWIHRCHVWIEYCKKGETFHVFKYHFPYL